MSFKPARVVFYRSKGPMTWLERILQRQEGVFFPEPPPDHELEASVTAIELGVHWNQPPDYGLQRSAPGGAVNAVTKALEGKPSGPPLFKEHFEWTKRHRDRIVALTILSGEPIAPEKWQRFRQRIKHSERPVPVRAEEVAKGYKRRIESREMGKPDPIEFLYEVYHKAVNAKPQSVAHYCSDLARKLDNLGEFEAAEALRTSTDHGATLRSDAVCIAVMGHRLHAAFDEGTPVPRLPGIAIHFVDDQPLDRHVRRFLEERGCHIKQTYTAESALRLLEDDPHPVVVVDAYLDETDSHQGAISVLTEACRSTAVKLTMAWSTAADRLPHDLLDARIDQPKNIQGATHIYREIKLWLADLRA
jgi:hypothetical protein